MYIILICHGAILHYHMSFKTIAGWSGDQCFLMISCTFWRSRKKLPNSPKLSCGFNNTEFVVILIRFLGTGTLPFCFRWASTTCALSVTHVQHGYYYTFPQKQIEWRIVPVLPDFFYLAIIGLLKKKKLLTVKPRTAYFSLRLGLPVLNMRHSAQAVLAQRRQNGRAQVPKNRRSIATNLVLLTLILRPIEF